MNNLAKRLLDLISSLKQDLEVLSEESSPETIDSDFPWESYISKFDGKLDEFAKKEKKKTLPKGKLRELESLHDSLRKAKKKLEDYFKTPPIARKDLDSEISAIQDAMADVLKGTGMKRVETSRYIFSLRRTPVYYKVVSEKTAVNSLRKKKLSRFINTIETLDMAKLKTFLKVRGLTIPGLKKMTADVSIYIYEKHEEGEPELIYVVGPEGFEEEYEDGYEDNLEDIEEEVSSSGGGESSSSMSSSSSESSSESSFSSEEEFAEKDKGLEWHLIPKDQRLGDIRETIENREPRKSDPFPDKVVEFIKEKASKSISDEKIDEMLCELIKKGEMPTWKMYISDSERYAFTEDPSEEFYDIPYVASRANNQQLGDDFRLVCAHYSTWKKTGGEGIKYTEKEILENAEEIIKEIKERVKAEKMNFTFTPEKMKKTSKELYGLVREELPENLKEVGEATKNSDYAGLYLTPPHPELIWTGAKTAIVKSKKFTEHVNEPLYLISDKDCWGIIKLSEAKEIDKKEFEERYEDHLIENYERIDWWDDKYPLFLYEVEMIEKFDPVKEVEIPQGIQVFILPKNVKFK